MFSWQGFREDDQEPNAFSLKEARINFPPTYPWSEDPLDFGNLMNTRAPVSLFSINILMFRNLNKRF